MTRRTVFKRKRSHPRRSPGVGGDERIRERDDVFKHCWVGGLGVGCGVGGDENKPPGG